MGPNQTYKLLHRKGNHLKKKKKENKKTTYRNTCKWYNRETFNLQNIQTAHTTQQQ